MDDRATFVCGVCGAASEIDIDPSGGDQQVYVEDCQVCCRPHRVNVRFDAERQTAEVQVIYEG